MIRIIYVSGIVRIERRVRDSLGLNQLSLDLDIHAVDIHVVAINRIQD